MEILVNNVFKLRFSSGHENPEPGTTRPDSKQSGGKYFYNVNLYYKKISNFKI